MAKNTMKPCSRCLWPMVSGGVCDKCGREDDEFTGSMLAAGFAIVALIIVVVFAIIGG